MVDWLAMRIERWGESRSAYDAAMFDLVSAAWGDGYRELVRRGARRWASLEGLSVKDGAS